MKRSFAALLLVAACGASPTPPTSPPTTSTGSAAPTTTGADPYASVHQMDADHADPAPQLRLPTSTIWLNGDELTIANASLAEGGATQTTTNILAPKKGYLGLHFAKPLATG